MRKAEAVIVGGRRDIASRAAVTREDESRVSTEDAASSWNFTTDGVVLRAGTNTVYLSK